MAEAIAAALVASSSSALVTAGFVIGGNAVAINAALALAASAAYGSQQQAAAKRRARNAFNASLKDREVMIRSGVAPQRLIYGRDRVSGPVVYAESTGANKEYLHLVIALAGHECDAIEFVYFNETALPAPDGSGNITSGDYCLTTTTAQYHEATASGGAVTLPQGAARVVAVMTNTGAGIDSQSSPYSSYSHTPGSATVSGLVSGNLYGINYETTASDPLVRVRKYLGTAAQTADADLVAESDGKWTSAHRGRGICYLYVRLKYHQDVFGQVGIPNITCVVRGKKVADPRSTTRWTGNAALVQADFLRDSTWGLGATAAQVPTSELTTAANLCEEQVDIDASTTQDRYLFSGSFTADQSPLDILRAISSSHAGAAVWTQGRWLVRPGAYRTPLLTISEDTLADGAITTVPKASRAELFNAVRATHRDDGRAYVEAQAPLVENATYTAQDGGRQIVRDLQLPFVCDPVRAQRLARIELERARQALTVQLRCNLKAYDLAPTDTVLLTLARYGWSAKPFEVIERTWSGGALQYTLRETAAAVFDWNYGYAYTYDIAPDTALPNPYARPAALTSLAVDSDAGMAVRLSSGAAVSRAYVTWAAAPEQFVRQGGRIDVQWVKARDTVWQSVRAEGTDTAAWLLGVPNGQGIIVRARAVTAMNSAGEWAYATHLVNGIGGVPSFGQFLDSFSAGYGLWRNYAGTVERSIVDVSDGELGGKALRIGNNSGNDAVAMVHDSNIAYDPQALYRVRARIRRTAGTGVVYVGVAGYLADGQTLCNYTGANSLSNQFFCAAAGSAPGSSWAIYEGYFSGAAATGDNNVHADPADPAVLHEDVRYVRPLLFANYTSAAGITEVDYFVIDKIRLTADLAPNSVTVGDITTSPETVGSTGSPGASGVAGFLLGPEITTAADEELDFHIACTHSQTYWSQAALGKVQVYLKYEGSPDVEITEIPRKKFPVPVDAYGAGDVFCFEYTALAYAPGAVTRSYTLHYLISYVDSAGNAKLCAKDFTATGQFRVVRRKR